VQLRNYCLIASTFAVMAAVPAAGARDAEVNVVVDMTAEGRKVPPPSPGHPVYYLPLMGAYQQRGQLTAGEPPPPSPTEIAHLVAVELAKQGYFVTNAKSAPSIILAIHYGYMNPAIVNDSPTGDPTSKVFFNQQEMLSLVGGETLKNADLDMEREHVMQGAEQDRYFVMVSAFDYATYADSRLATASAAGGKHPSKPPQKILLWQAKISTPSNAVSLEAVLPILVKAGAPQFGRETVRPIVLMKPLPEGRVEIGTPEVKGIASPADVMSPPPPPASPGR
jgi:hypothetical protein